MADPVQELSLEALALPSKRQRLQSSPAAFESPSFFPPRERLYPERLDLLEHDSIRRLCKVFSKEQRPVAETGVVSYSKQRKCLVFQQSNKKSKNNLLDLERVFLCQTIGILELEHNQVSLYFCKGTPYELPIEWPVLVLQPLQLQSLEQITRLFDSGIRDSLDLDIFDHTAKPIQIISADCQINSLEDIDKPFSSSNLVWLIGTSVYLFFPLQKVKPLRMATIKTVLDDLLEKNEGLMHQFNVLSELHMNCWRTNQHLRLQDCQRKQLQNRIVKSSRGYGFIFKVLYSTKKTKVCYMMFEDMKAKSVELDRPLAELYTSLNTIKMKDRELFMIEVYREKMQGKVDSVNFIEGVLLRRFNQHWFNSEQRFDKCLLRLLFNDVKQTITSKSVCSSCFQIVHNLPARDCPFCKRVFHEQCVQQEFRLQNIWLCGFCRNCNNCFSKMQKSESNRCLTCRKQYHRTCGIIQRSNGKFKCNLCSKCEMCKTNLYFQIRTDCKQGVFCSKCYEQIRLNNYCKVCRVKQTKDQQNSKAWLLCGMCALWVHKRCDSILNRSDLFKLMCNRDPSNNIVYNCKQCRLQFMRVYYKEGIRWISMLDTYGFFVKPDYDQLPNYKLIVTQPMDFTLMSLRASQGYYDVNTVNTIMIDYQQLIDNAFKYNLSQDRPHLEARKLLALKQFTRQFLVKAFRFDEEDMLRQRSPNLAQFSNQATEFVKQAQSAYLQAIFNLGSKSVRLQIKPKVIPTSEGLFDSRKVMQSLTPQTSIKIYFKNNNVAQTNNFDLRELFLKRSYKLTQVTLSNVNQFFMPICRRCNSYDVKRCSTCLEHFCLQDACQHIGLPKYEQITTQRKFQKLSLQVRRKLLQIEQMQMHLYVVERILNINGPFSIGNSVKFFKAFQSFFRGESFLNYFAMKLRIEQLKSSLSRLHLDVKASNFSNLKHHERTTYQELKLLDSFLIFDINGFILNRKNLLQLLTKPDFPKQVGLLSAPKNFRMPEEPVSQIFKKFSLYETMILNKILKFKEIYQRMKALCQTKLEDLSFKRFGSITILEHEDLSVRDGEILLAKTISYMNALLIRIKRFHGELFIGASYFDSFPVNKSCFQMHKVTSSKSFYDLLVNYDSDIKSNTSFNTYLNFNNIDSAPTPHAVFSNYRKAVMLCISKGMSPFQRRSHLSRITTIQVRQSVKPSKLPYVVKPNQFQSTSKLPINNNVKQIIEFGDIESQFQKLDRVEREKFSLTYYKQLKSKPPPVFVGPSKIHGLGLFAALPINKSQFIIEYVGQILREPVADFYERKYELQGQKTCYMFSLQKVQKKLSDQELIVDATHVGNQARFLNHSCDVIALPAQLLSQNCDFRGRLYHHPDFRQERHLGLR